MDWLLYALGLACAIAAHFLVPYLIRRAAGVAIAYRPYLFQSLVPGELAMLTRGHFDTHTPDLTSLGYVPLGDFLQQDKPLWQVERLFLHRDGRSFAGLVQCRRTRCVAFVSILADGTYFETVNVVPPLSQPEADIPFRFQCLRSENVRELCARHKAEMLRMEAEHGPPRAFGPQQSRDVIEYGRLLSFADLHRKGICPEPPQAVAPRGDSGVFA